MTAHKAYAVIDFETTGFGGADRVIEVGVVLLDRNLDIEDQWETLVRPERDISNSFVHHITASDVTNAPTFSHIAKYLAHSLAGRSVIAHNAPFEARFLTNEFARLGLSWPQYGAWVVDTLRLAKHAYPGESGSLENLTRMCGLTNTHPHAALGDALVTAELFAHLVTEAGIRVSSEPLVLPSFEYPEPGLILPRGMKVPMPFTSHIVGNDDMSGSDATLAHSLDDPHSDIDDGGAQSASWLKRLASKLR